MKRTITVLLSVLAMTSIAQIPTNGLVAHFPFNGNANDQTLNANNGTVNGATLVTDRFGNLNSAYSFNGTTDFISVPSSPSIASFPNGQTISLWLKIASLPTNGKENTVLDKRDNTHKYYQVFLSDFANPNAAVYRFGESGAVSSQANNINFTDLAVNQWFNLTYTTNLDTTKSYLNGVLKNTFVSASPIGANTNPLLFGKSNQSWPTDAPYNGALDDVRIYDRALTSKEVIALFNEGICYQSLNVTDTLTINMSITGFNPITYANNIKIYPNPTYDQLNISIANSSSNGYQIKILNTLSQVLYQQTISQQSYSVNLNSFSTGTYFVNILDGVGNLVEVKKIVLQ